MKEQSIVFEKDSFDEIFIRSIEEAFSYMFGENTSKGVWYYIEAAVPKSEIPRKIDLFERTLVDIFGKGALLVERQIILKCYSNIGEPPPNGDLSFLEAISRLKEDKDSKKSSR